MRRLSAPALAANLAALLILLLGASCRRATSTPLTGDLSGESLQQTLEAMSLAEAPATSAPGEVFPQGTIPPLQPTDAPPPVLFPQTANFTPPPGAIEYQVRSGDTLAGLAGRFGVKPGQIVSALPLPDLGFLIPGQRVYIPDVLEGVTPPDLLLPDSELVYSPAAATFDVQRYVQEAGGFLSVYSESVAGRTLTGAQIVQRVADELSVNPRLLLAFLEYRARWVLGQPAPGASLDYPIGFEINGREGLYQELVITATQLNMVYYGWRKGNYTLIEFPDKTARRLNPRLNAGSASLQNLMAIFYRESDWRLRVYGEQSFPVLYAEMFGDPWERAARVEPLLPHDLQQPTLELPFAPGETWHYSSGPHYSWNFGTPRGALDFSPTGKVELCAVSPQWITASAPGLVVRAAFNAVVLDLESDGFEQVGWALLYYHVAEEEMIPAGTQVAQDAPLGHPSCQGGRATAAHVHLARKYNGEWLPADDIVPFVLSGWTVAGEGSYQGALVKGEMIIPANAYGSLSALVRR